MALLEELNIVKLAILNNSSESTTFINENNTTWNRISQIFFRILYVLNFYIIFSYLYSLFDT